MDPSPLVKYLMKKAALVLVLTFASLSPALAQEVSPPKQMRVVLGAGLTFGGDRLVTAENQNDLDMDIRAGGTYAFNAGVDYRVNDALSLQATLGYHVDTSSFFFVMGDASFRRYPVEVLAYYNVSPKWRVGGGARYLGSPTLKAEGWFGNQDVKFDSSVGGVVEAEYAMGRHVGIKLRYVHETIEGKVLTRKADASHLGIFASYYF
jgi:hypothetical protein